MKVVITGANGFVGSALRARLVAMPGYEVVSVVRQGGAGFSPVIEVVDLAIDALPPGSLKGVDAIVHTAARVHMMQDTARDSLALCRRVNVDATLKLARQAAADGVKRFVFLSTAKVHGEASEPGRSFKETDRLEPRDAYAQSKCEAEQALFDLGSREAMEVVVVRPPLVYGPGVRANFRTMMHWVYRCIPLPLRGIENRRSLVALDNLVDFIQVCLTHPAANNQAFLVADGHDLSTPALLRALARAMGRRARLLPVPGILIFSRLLGQGPAARRLGGNFQVSIDKAREVLGWRPPVGVEEAMERTAKDYLETRRPG